MTHRLVWLRYFVFVMNFVLCLGHMVCIFHALCVVSCVDSAWSLCLVSRMLCFVLTDWYVLFMSDTFCVLLILLDLGVLWAVYCVLFWLVDLYCSWVTHSVFCWFCLIRVGYELHVVSCVDCTSSVYVSWAPCFVLTVLDAYIYWAASFISAWVLLLDVFVFVCVMCKFLCLLMLCPPVHSFLPVCLEWKFTNNFYHTVTFLWFVFVRCSVFLTDCIIANVILLLWLNVTNIVLFV